MRDDRRAAAKSKQCGAGGLSWRSAKGLFCLFAIIFLPLSVWAAISNAPSGLTASSLSYTQVKLTWTDNSTDETYFYIEYKKGSTGAYATLTSVSVNTTAYTHTGATADTTYYYRVRAYNASGYSPYSDEASATTPAVSAPSNLVVTAQSSSQINLTWTDNSNDETGFSIERKTGAGGTYAAIANIGANVTSYTNNSLTQNTEYYYRVRAYSGSSYSQYSNDASATTMTLNAPSNLVVDTVSYSQIKLTWTDNSGDETYFSIERKSGSSNYAQIGTASANATTYTNSSLTQNTEYYYRVRAVSGSNYSAYSNEVNAATPTLGAPSDLTAAPLSSTQIKLAWTDNSSDETQFYIEYKKSTDNSFMSLTSVPANITTYTHTNLTQNTAYVYRVRAYHSGSSAYSAFSNEAGATTMTLNAPSGLSVSSLSYTQVALTWTDNSADETGFYIERKTGAGGTYAQVGSAAANATAYTSTGLTQGTEYYFRVRAYSGSNFSSYSNEVNPTTPVLSAPSGLAATALSSSQIKLTWTDNSSDETYFYIEYKTTGSYITLTTVPANTTTYTHTGLSQSTAYSYRVRAYHSGSGAYSAYTNESSASTPAFAAPSDLAAVPLSSTQSRLTWTDNSSDETYFFIEYKKATDVNFTQLTTVSANTTTYTHTNLTPNTTYYYRVRGYNSVVYSAYSNEANATTLPFAAPSDLAAVALSSTQIKLTWTDNTGDEAYFYIEYKKSTDANFTPLTSVSANMTAYTHANLTPNMTYAYRVRAYNYSVGYSPYSNEANATTQAFTAPSNLSAVTLSSTQIKLTWQDNTADETYFYIEYKIAGAGYFSQLTSVPANTTTYTHTNLAPNTTYAYHVQAYSYATGYSAYSNEASATAQDPPPTGLQAAALSSKRIKLTWTDVSGETQYSLEYRTGATGDYTVLATLPANTTTYSHTALTAATAYSYRIRAYNGVSYTPYSNEVSATTPECVEEGTYQP